MRLTRVGSKKNPIYRVVVADSRSPRDQVHRDRRWDNLQTDPSTIELDETKVKDWLGKGAQPSDAVSKLIKAFGNMPTRHSARLVAASCWMTPSSPRRAGRAEDATLQL